ncbi:MAG: hypothetical protein KC422_05345 [Trueperaceae bacterium]|nr:hypothetical protein [Trueperaceae bacterium]
MHIFHILTLKSQVFLMPARVFLFTISYIRSEEIPDTYEQNLAQNFYQNAIRISFSNSNVLY